MVAYSPCTILVLLSSLDDVTYVYDDVTYVYDDVTYVYDDVTYVVTCPLVQSYLVTYAPCTILLHGDMPLYVPYMPLYVPYKSYLVTYAPCTILLHGDMSLYVPYMSLHYPLAYSAISSCMAT